MSRVLRSCTIAVVTVGLAALALATSAPLWAGGAPPVGVFVLPILAAAWLGDVLAVGIAAVLVVLTALYAVPGGGLSGLGPTGYVRLAVFLAIAGSVAALVHRLRANERAERRTTAELQVAEQRLRQGLDAARMVAWRWDPQTDLIVRTGRVREIFGLEETARGSAFYDVVHPLDRERYRQVVEDAIARRSGFDIVFRLLPEDGRAPRWVEKRAAPTEGPGGAFGGFTGVAQDVTDRYNLQAAVRARELQLRVIVDAVPALIAYVDRERRYGLVNRAYEEWFGAGHGHLSGSPVEEVLGAEYFETLRPHLDAALAGRHVEFETELPDREGTMRVLRASYVPDVDGDEVCGVFVLVLDVTHDRRREQALGEAEREARLANELKDQFLATLSHELRTPLNAMLGYARMAQAGAVSPGLAIEVIERNARLQARLVEDLLDVSRMVSGKLQFVMGRVDPGTVVADVVHMLQPLADAKMVALTAELPPDTAPALAGDGARLRQMLVNLVSNAIKFTAEGGGVRVRLTTRDGGVEISVQDNGIGIDATLLPVIFDRFRQADSSATREHGGLGLGLSIAKSIAEAHRGTIAVESAGPGCGTTFTVRLPVETHALREAEVQAT